MSGEARPRVSVCIPVYNTSSYLERCMESVLAQSLRDLEIVVVDDGSTDGSAEIIAKYAAGDSRIVSHRQTNAGLGATRNTGLRLASGDFVAFLDSDDWVEADCYESMVRAASENSADLVICDYTVHAPGGTSVYRHSPEVCNRGQYITALLERRAPGFSWNKLYRRHTLSVNRLAFPVRGELENLEDQYYSLRAAYASAVVAVVRRPLVNYRIHGQSIVQRYQPTLMRDMLELHSRNHQLLREQEASKEERRAMDIALLFGVFGCVLNECKETNPNPISARMAVISKLSQAPAVREAYRRTNTWRALGAKVAVFLSVMRWGPAAVAYVAARLYRQVVLRKVF